jgi:hypothetical protein
MCNQNYPRLLWACAGRVPLEFAPPMHVHRILELLAQSLDLDALLKQLALQVIHLVVRVRMPDRETIDIENK